MLGGLFMPKNLHNVNGPTPLQHGAVTCPGADTLEYMRQDADLFDRGESVIK